MVYDLMDWLAAQFDADERAATAANGIVGQVVAPNQREADLAAAHVARHKPARTLRAVAAKRRIFERHGPILNTLLPGPVCMCCPDLNDETGNRSEPWPCLTVRLLTVEYNDQPGYQPEWGPQ